MTCLNDGIFRARLDGELAGKELEEVNQHLTSCPDCHARFEKLSAEMTVRRICWLPWLQLAATQLIRWWHMPSSAANLERPKGRAHPGSAASSLPAGVQLGFSSCGIGGRDTGQR